jgi:hypothetical protein
VNTAAQDFAAAETGVTDGPDFDVAVVTVTAEYGEVAHAWLPAF